MSTKAQIKRFEKSLDIIKSITRAFEHTANKRMVVNKREITNLGKQLSEIKQSYVDIKISVAKKKKDQQLLLRSQVRGNKRGKIAILISSEPAYYGNLLGYMCDTFIREIENGADALIVGKPGREEFDKRNLRGNKYLFYDLDDLKPNWQVVNKVAQIASQYSQINVIFAQFRSILKQDVQNLDLVVEMVNAKPSAKKQYLIKPNAKAALTFLENGIITNQILAKLYENGLAKSAIRVRILEIGEIAEKLSEALEKFEIYKRRVIHDINNRKLVSLYASSSVWENESIFTVYR